MASSDYMPYITVALAFISGVIGFVKLSNDGATARARISSKMDDINVRMVAVELKQSKIVQMASDMAAMRTDISWIKGIISVGGHNTPNTQINN